MPKLEVLRNAGVIKSLPNLLTRIRRARRSSPTSAVWLRGVPDEKHDLVPSIGRRHTFAGRTRQFDRDVERQMLHQFRRYAFEFFGRALTDWEALLVARHHGLPVRLLDWTSDPLAAMYFACEFNTANQPPNGKIWLLIPNTNLAHHLDVFGDTPGPLDVKGIKLVYPMVVAARINAQSGLFTIQEDPWTPLDHFEKTEYDDAHLDVLRLVELIVPSADRTQRLKELNDLGVNRRTLFPDLDGLSAGMITSHILRG